ncbi:MaoC family dehydratase [Cumulibacter soli]|uniref:MaoC family dehydratase n=1 Tax=Cumulibacter soli TaxID=2546344 RepID=UPI001068B492|nr:MaoC family dehydratase [Cumulibacter soli]
MAEVKVFNGIDDLKASVGQSYGPTDWFEVSQDRVNAFADATEDHQWIHVDVEKAKSGPFGATIAHGFLTLSLIPMFGPQLTRVDNVKMGVNYGCDKVRFPHPVPVGSKLRASAKLLDVTDIAMGSRATWEWTIEAEGIDKPVCVASMLSVIVA